ncbi:hypothetical protein, partial [Streptomyces solincola]|uniref:hypothetical protein n=1 Tax=Streptomyces solincola TaxID=2100817 RepID=UPI0015E2927A
MTLDPIDRRPDDDFPAPDGADIDADTTGTGPGDSFDAFAAGAVRDTREDAAGETAERPARPA